MTSSEPGPSRALSPPLLEILGRPLRITVRPQPTANEAWETVRTTMDTTLWEEVTMPHAVERADLNEGWSLLH
jgi:hypothetical protein